ncbi:MAG TPA: hypothetical protein VGD78_22755 [Chthoniobacterales bacterium]
MPIIESGRAPQWCELEHFAIVRLKPGEDRLFERLGLKEKLVVGQGKCTITAADKATSALEGSNIDLIEGNGCFRAFDVQEEAVLIWLAGRWGDKLGGSGLFTVQNSADPKDSGDTAPYPKQTNFDRHYHDCDEYWIIFAGSALVVSEDRFYPLKAGQCLATGMGHHHDFPEVLEPVSAVYFETTLEGQQRVGHLWNHTHGQAQPRIDRV